MLCMKPQKSCNGYLNVKIQLLILFKQKNYSGMNTQKECHRKDYQGELWNGPHQKEGKEEDHLSPTLSLIHILNPKLAVVDHISVGVLGLTVIVQKVDDGPTLPY